jgi:hypothetical protein
MIISKEIVPLMPYVARLTTENVTLKCRFRYRLGIRCENELIESMAITL